MELVKDRETLEPATAEASDVVNRMRERGILLGTDGPFANVLKIRPPMPFTRENADQLVATLDEVLAVISIVIPAYNEEALLDATLGAVRAAAEALGSPYEIIVVDDGSTDRTAEIARAHGARVVGVNLRHIAAARNAGAREAAGDLLIFVDADTLITPDVLQGRRRVGARGRGRRRVRAPARTPTIRPGVRRYSGSPAWLMRTAGWAAGCFMFVRTDVFRRVGGFDERYFASEEIHLSRALKKHGRLVILRDKVITSGRKGRLFTGREVLSQFVTALWPANLEAARSAAAFGTVASGRRTGNEDSDNRDARGGWRCWQPQQAPVEQTAQGTRDAGDAGGELRRAGRRLRGAARQVPRDATRPTTASRSGRTISCRRSTRGSSCSPRRASSTTPRARCCTAR